jgi:hypothetical protein
VFTATSDLPHANLDLTPAAERVINDFGRADDGFVLEAARSAELVLDAIARSDGTRASVLEELKASRVKDGPPLREDRAGLHGQSARLAGTDSTRSMVAPWKNSKMPTSAGVAPVTRKTGIWAGAMSP